jgi:hypothetical protein
MRVKKTKAKIKNWALLLGWYGLYKLNGISFNAVA